MLYKFLMAVSLTFIFISCEKTTEVTCTTPVHLSATNTAPAVGESFTITARRGSENDLFHWWEPGNYSSVYGTTLTVDDPGYLDRGWYYCSKSNTACSRTLVDSIFIDVKLQQGTPPCTITNNSITGGSIPTTNFYNVYKNFDPSFNGVALHGSATYGYPADFRLLFNSNNGNTEPVDGIYTTTNTPLFSQTDPYIWVSLSFVYGGQFYHCHPDQKVYVSHVNGKLSASFCDVPFSNGTYIFNVSGKLTEY